jgi:hypothetical protein
MPSPQSVRLDPPAVRIRWLKMLRRTLGRRDRDGVYRAMLAEIDRLIADAARERPANDAGSAR